jgi:hypothetical protein
VVKSTGKAFVMRKHLFLVPKLDELPVHRMTDDVEAKLK